MNQFLEWLAGFMLSTMKQVDPGPEDPLDPVDPLEPEKAMVDALNIALSAGDPARLLAFLTSPMGEAVPRSWDWLGLKFAQEGDTGCLRVLHQCGFALSDWTWVQVVARAHINCLEFAVSNGYTLDDEVLYHAILSGELASVEFLLKQGLPRKPYFHWLSCNNADQLKCVQMVLDKEDAIDPAILIRAAERGEVEFVRWLHERGVPLWQHAWHPDKWGYSPPKWTEPPGTFVFPWRSEPPALWKVLRYAAVHGAPITPRGKQLLEEKRQRTHAVLLSFKAAARLCKGPGNAEERRMWDSMAAVPAALIEEILILANLEIRESIMRCLPQRATVLAL